MTNKKSTKRALLTSSVSLLLCFAMLLGTTFAWFTDSVASANNIIKAGNLDVELYHTNGTDTDEEVGSTTPLFDEVALWEPGAMVWEELTVKNAGSLALKYNLSVNITEISSVNGKSLADVLKVAVMDAQPTRETVATAATKPLATFNVESDKALSPGISDTFYVAIYWAPSANDNDYNVAGEVLNAKLGVNLVATQLEAELDSFDNTYDADAKYPGEVGTAAELAAALANNESVKLLNDITLTGEWTPIGDKDAGIYYTGTLDGGGYTISGLSVTSGDYVALISAAKDATIMNLTVEGSVEGENAAGVVARVEGDTVIENVISNVAVRGTTKAGGITCNVTNSGKTVFTNCVNNGAVSGGDNGIGGIVGYVNNNAYVEIIACTNNANVTSDNNKYAGAAVGYAAGTSKGIVADMKNTGTVTGTLLNDGRFLKYGDTVLCGYVGTVGNWTAALIATPENVQSVVDSILEGATVQLSAGKYSKITAKSNITILGVPGAVVDCVDLNGAANVNLLHIDFDAAGAQAAYDASGTQRATANIISGSKTTAVGARNIVIDGCTFTGKFASYGAAIAFVDRSRPTGGSGNVTVKNCTFNTETVNYDIYGYYTGAANMTFTLENNTFASACRGSSIYLGRLKTSEAIVVNGNAFNTKASLEDAVYVQGDTSYNPTLNAADNTFAE